MAIEATERLSWCRKKSEVWLDGGFAARRLVRLKHLHFWCIQRNRFPTRLFTKYRVPRQASLLGWKKSRTSLSPTVQNRSEML
jgi:hypothetical protein